MDKKDEIKERLQKYIESGNSIKYSVMEEKDSELLNGIYKHMGNIKKACNEIGITDRELREDYGFQIKYPEITEDELILRLEFLSSIGELKTKNLKSTGGYFNDSKAFKMLIDDFGEVDKGLEYYGYENQYKITHDKIKRKLTKYAKDGYNLSYSEMCGVDVRLVDAIRNRFSSYYAGLDYYGVEYTRRYNVLSVENIIDRLDNIKKQFGVINYSLLKKHDGSVLFYAYEHYGSLDSMLIELGYGDFIQAHPNELIQAGHDFESVFCHILDYMDIPYDYNKVVGDVRPDFQLSNGVWIDTKLSTWTPSIQETINKYHDKCDKLIIVYRRGDKKMLQYYNTHKKTEFIHVEDLIMKLPERNKEIIIHKMQSIENNIVNIEP